MTHQVFDAEQRTNPKKGTDHSVPNPHPSHARQPRFGGQSGLSPFSRPHTLEGQDK